MPIIESLRAGEQAPNGYDELLNACANVLWTMKYLKDDAGEWIDHPKYAKEFHHWLWRNGKSCEHSKPLQAGSKQRNQGAMFLRGTPTKP